MRRACRPSASTCIPELSLSRSACRRPPTSCGDFLGRLECMPTVKSRARLPGQSRDRRRHRLHAGDRAHCRSSPSAACARAIRKRALADGVMMRVPRKPINGRRLQALFAGGVLPYAHHWRLFRTPNDAFLPPIRIAKASRCSTSCSRPRPASTAAPSIRPPRATRSSPTTWCARARDRRQARRGRARRAVIALRNAIASIRRRAPA